jgi:hypothetical protein
MNSSVKHGFSLFHEMNTTCVIDFTVCGYVKGLRPPEAISF